jgi:acyl carrier protein
MEVQNIAVKEKSATEIQDWIVAYLADLLEKEPEEVDVTIPFDRYGLDSSAAVGLTGDLEDWLGIEIDPTIIYDYPTVEALSEHISSLA